MRVYGRQRYGERRYGTRRHGRIRYVKRRYGKGRFDLETIRFRNRCGLEAVRLRKRSC